MLFWVVAALVTSTSLLLVLAPLLRGAGAPERRASYDVRIYRDQLREIDQDIRRGVLTEDEARDSRIEISRKLLAAAEAEAAEDSSAGAPRRVTHVAAAAVGLAAVALTGALYMAEGAPGYRDQPRAERLARQAAARMDRPRQAEVEAAMADHEADHEAGAATGPAADGAAARPEDVALVERLQALLADRPNDLEGHRLLARSLGGLGRYDEAWRAQERVVAILDADGGAGAAELTALAELMIVAAHGYVSPEAEAALSRALELEPTHPAGRYYHGLALVQGGRPDLAYRRWSQLREEGPPDAPWVRAIDAQIDDVARLAGIAPMDAGAAAPEMTAADGAMAEGMVASLGARLAAEGGPAEEWAQLIRSLGVLGRSADAEAVWREARAVFAADALGLALVADAARGAGVAE